MASWYALVAGEQFSLSDRAPFALVSAQGVGIAPTRRITQRGPLQHGDTDIDYRLDPRNINLVLALTAETRSETDAARDLLAYIFGPRLLEPVVLGCIRDDGQVRHIDAHAAGIVDTPIEDGERIGTFQRVAVQLVANDPNWYDPAIQPSYFTSATGGWTVPMVVPFVVPTTGSFASSFPIAYLGTFDEYPAITLIGSITNPVITNLTTGDVLDFTGLSLALGQSIEIDLRYGYKTVTDNTGVNRIAALSAGSDLATWRFLSVLATTDGINNIHVQASGIAVPGGVQFRYYHRFVSL